MRYIGFTICLVAAACCQSLAIDNTSNDQAPLDCEESSDCKQLNSKESKNVYTVRVEYTVKQPVELDDFNTSKLNTQESSSGNESESTVVDDIEVGNQSREISSDSHNLVITDSSGESEDLDTKEELLKETTHGPVRGFKWGENNIYAYIDIPYGKIDKPFEDPKSAQNWAEVHEVKDHNVCCPQYHDEYRGDLNCLTLSIFAPAEVKEAGVLFYVHDSGFRSGDPLTYGPEHLVSKGVILVLPNYRIGALGFLCLQNETAPGNAGLKDLALALEWTKNNIEVFGGNPRNIAVGGHGDAGALVGYLALSSSSKYNINKVITDSGTMLSPLAFDRNPVGKATELANIIRNIDSYESEYQNIFAEASVRKIVEAAIFMKFKPCMEKNNEAFLSVSPWTLLQNKEINMPFMIGAASHAGAHEALALSESFIEELNENPGLVLPGDLSFSTTEAKNEQALRIKSQYFKNTVTIKQNEITELSLLVTDASYLGPLIRFARPLVAAGAAVYLYEFEFVGELNHELISLNSPVDGAVRNDIIGYLFNQNDKQIDSETREAAMMNLMVDLHVSFINKGTPAADNIKWNKMKAGADSEEEFLKISSEPKLVKGVHLDRLRLWTELYQEYFIERSFAFSITPSYYVFIITFWVTYTKLDYH